MTYSWAEFPVATEPVTLPVHCVRCGGVVTLQMTDYPNVVTAEGRPPAPDHPALQRAFWHCPYCSQGNQGGIPGKLAWVTKGHELERGGTAQ